MKEGFTYRPAVRNMCSRCIPSSYPPSMTTMLGNLQRLGFSFIVLWILKYVLSDRTRRSGTVVLPMSNATPIESSSYAASMAVFIILGLCVSSVRCSSLHGPVVLFWFRLLLRVYHRMVVFFKQEITLPCLLIICGCWYPLPFLVYVATCSAISILLLCYLLAFFVVVMMIRASEGILCVRAIEILLLTLALTLTRTRSNQPCRPPSQPSQPSQENVRSEINKNWRECMEYLSISYHLR